MFFGTMSFSFLSPSTMSTLEDQIATEEAHMAKEEAELRK